MPLRLPAGLVVGASAAELDVRVSTVQARLAADSASGASYLTDNSGDVDVWVSSAISGTTNGGAWSGVITYKISYDRMVTFNYTLTFSGAPTAGAAAFNIVPTALQCDKRTYGAGKSPANAAISQRIEANSATITVFAITTALGTYEGTVVYPLVKPTW